MTTTLFKSREGLASSKRCRIGREHSFPCIGGRGLSAVVDSERMVLCEEEVVTILKNQIPLQLGKLVPSESLLRIQLLLFSK